MNTIRKLSLVLLFFSFLIGASDGAGVYCNELKALKKNQKTKVLLDDKKVHQGLRSIQADILEYKSSSLFQRFTRIYQSVWLLQSGCIAFNFFVATSETMPLLHSYIEKICQKVGIAVPAIYITRSNWIANAFASKLFASPGIIVISRKLVQDLSDEGLEAVIAHEIGHIKGNHNNKLLAISVLSRIAVFKAFTTDLMVNNVFNYSPELYTYSCKTFNHIVPKLIIGKRFEKEADAFAFTCGKANGIIEFCNYMENNTQIREQEFASTYAMLQNNRNALLKLDYYFLLGQYLVMKGLHKGYQFIEFIVINTFLDPHPSYESRIAAAQKYLEQHS